jgi:hypothetical protein
VVATTIERPIILDAGHRPPPAQTAHAGEIGRDDVGLQPRFALQSTERSRGCSSAGPDDPAKMCDRTAQGTII